MTLSQPLTTQETKVSTLFHRQCTRNASGHGNISTSTLKNCAHQPAALFTYIYNSSLRQCSVLVCFKTSTILPVPKKCNIDREMHAESLGPRKYIYIYSEELRQPTCCGFYRYLQFIPPAMQSFSLLQNVHHYTNSQHILTCGTDRPVALTSVAM